MKKKIAIISTAMVVGGVEKVLTELLKNFDLNRYEVDLWLSGPGGAFERLIPADVKVRYWGQGDTKELLLSSIRERKLYPVIRGLWYRLLVRVWRNDWYRNSVYSVKALPMCDNEKYDCVIAYQGISIAILATALYRFKATKKIAWIHGAGPLAQLRSHRSFVSKVYRSFDHIFCVSKQTKKLFCEQVKGVGKKTSVFYNLVDKEDIITRSVEERVILRSTALVTVGRLSYEKGQDMIPKVARLLLDAGYDIYWYLVGDGAARQKIREQIEIHQVEDHVILLGTRTNPFPYIRDCDIYVQPSLSEGFCTTTVEAKILRKPVVTTDAPGMREQFVNGENGLIVDAMTPEALFDGIRKLIDHPELRQKFTEVLEKENFDNTQELQKLYDLI